MEQRNGLGVTYIKDGKIYISLERIFKSHKENLEQFLIFAMSHEMLHKVVGEEQDWVTSVALDTRYMRRLLDCYMGGIAVGI